MSDGANFGELLRSAYVIEVVIALLLGIALIPLIRSARRIEWPPSSRWRHFLVYVGWFLGIAAFITWCLLLWIVGEAWIDSINPNLPKKASFIVLILGGILYFFLVSMSGTAFRASSGSARSDVMERVGRRKG